MRDTRISPGRRHPAPVLLAKQIRYQNKSFWRSPIAAFFTVIFPLMLLLIFVAVFGNDPIPEAGGITMAQFYAPVLAVFGAVSAAFTSLAINTALARDLGILKRIRGTPLPPWIYLAGRIGAAGLVAAAAVVLMLGVGVVAFDVQILAANLPAAILTFLIGVFCWAALGLALVGLAPNADAVQVVANVTLLPLAFFSSIFFTPAMSPAWVDTVGSLFPLRHFAQPFGDAFNPFLETGPFDWPSLAVMAAWGLAGSLVALRYFRWEPRGGPTGRSRRGARPAG